VLIRDHHAGYISWEDYESNLRTINGNANMKGEISLIPSFIEIRESEAGGIRMKRIGAAY